MYASSECIAFALRESWVCGKFSGWIFLGGGWQGVMFAFDQRWMVANFCHRVVTERHQRQWAVT